MDRTQTYAGTDPELGGFEQAQILLQSIPYDGTSTWGKGADKGFAAFLEASENMELYDIETGSEVYRKGVHLLPPVQENRSPEAVYAAVLETTRKLLGTGKFLTFFGGEHSVSIGIIEAYKEKYPDLTVLQLDAHADLRKEYLGSAYNHACAMHQARLSTNLIQVGIRSMDISEKPQTDHERCFYAQDIMDSDAWMEEAIERMTGNVYLSMDLDVLDPSIFPATGTPEPGGMTWYQVIRFLRKVIRERNLVGFDLVEFAPIEGLNAPDFLVAKLYYKIISYKFHP